MGLFDLFSRTATTKTPAPSRADQPRLWSARSILSDTIGSFATAGMPQAAGAGRLESTWAGTPTTIDSWIFHYWSRIVARSREQAENNDHLKKFLQMARDNIAGPTGFTFNAQIRDPSGTMDTVASSAIEDAFADWSKRGNYDITGQLSRADGERLAVTTAAMDGEVICIKKYGEDLNKWGFAVQFIDPVLLNPTKWEKLNNGNVIRHGIEFNPNGRPVAYHFRNYDEMMMGYINHNGESFQRVPADQVIHRFLPERVGQKRGLPWARTALWRMRMLAGFEDAAVVNARVSASKMGFFRNLDGDSDDILEMDAEPGKFEDIGNREFIPYTPQFPDQAFDPFCKAMLRSISSGLGVSYNNLASDLTSVNFSSIRQGALDEREVWKGLQEWLISGFVLPIYESWLERSLLANKILIAGKPLKFDRLEKYKQVAFTGRRWAWIDPSAEMAANEKAISQKLKSRSEIIRETSNRDPEDVWSEIEREEVELKKRGIVPLIPAGAAAPVAQPDPQP